MVSSVTDHQATCLLEWLDDCLDSPDCRSCERFQTLVSVLEVDAATANGIVAFEVPRERVHCRACPSCLPADVYTAYLRDRTRCQPCHRAVAS